VKPLISSSLTAYWPWKSAKGKPDTFLA